MGAAPVMASAAPPPSAVMVEGDSACPSAAEVAAHVATLLPGGAPAGSPPVARVDRAGADVSVRLADPSGALVAQRHLPAAGDCTELAELVAVTITTWMTELRPEWLPAPQLPRVVVDAPAPRERLGFDAGLGAGVSLGEGGAAGAASLLMALHAGARGLGAIVRATATTGRDVSIGAGVATWRRWEITAGPSYQVPLGLGRWRLAGSLGLSAGWLSAEGRDFAVNQTSRRFSPGAAGLVRVARAGGAWSPWFALGASVAFFDQPLIVVGNGERRSLHAVTVDALLGISFGRFP
jgi:hypothetical protein